MACTLSTDVTSFNSFSAYSPGCPLKRGTEHPSEACHTPEAPGVIAERHKLFLVGHQREGGVAEMHTDSLCPLLHTSEVAEVAGVA